MAAATVCAVADPTDFPPGNRAGTRSPTGEEREAQDYDSVQRAGQDHDSRSILRHYCKGGPWGHIFDGQPNEDNSEKILRVHELRGLIVLGERVSAPATELVLHGVESRLSGAPTFIFVDEAWRTLNDLVSGEWLYEAIRTFRKRNAGIILATQSLTEIAASPYCNLLLESCPAKVVFAEPRGPG